MEPAGLAGGAEKDETGTAGFFACFGFFFSRLLRCWPLAMAALLKECGFGDGPNRYPVSRLAGDADWGMSPVRVS